ncbi:MAG: phosphoesterase [Lentisphaerae bacterium]|jgi:predicted phosphodiesterase|nr:phosphoesterase [Lentisphaerota bacterium]
MKIHFLSDLHLEFGDYAPAPVDADIIVLAGDIHIKGRAIPWIQRTYPRTPVVYVAGNHEYYRKALPKMDDDLRKTAMGTHIHFLENEEFFLGDVRFLGCVLWTNFTLFGFDQREACMQAAERAMYDYALIRVSPKYDKLTPLHSAGLHRQSREWLEEQFAAPFSGRTVVVTHHAPSRQSLQKRHRNDPVSTAFAEDMEAFILKHAPDLWIHGHTHYCVDYAIGETRILSNQRGYADELVKEFRPDVVVEIE